MPGTIYKVVARTGNSQDIPLLINGEIGYDVDLKVFRVGDDTINPTKIPTSKTVGDFQYDPSLTVIFGNVDTHAEGKFDGVSLKHLNEGIGFLAKNEAGDFKKLTFITDEYVTIYNGDGTDEDVTTVRFGVSDALLEKIAEGGNNGAGIPYFYGDTPPDEAPKGALFYNTTLEMLFIYLADNDSDTSTWAWVDIQSVGSKYRNGGVTFFSSLNPPETASVGDEWQDTALNKTYKYFSDANGFYWRQIAI